MKKLNYKLMVADIDKLLERDWAFDMIDGKRMPLAEPYTQKEAREMSTLLGKIYMIAHCIHCKACQKSYLI